MKTRFQCPPSFSEFGLLLRGTAASSKTDKRCESTLSNKRRRVMLWMARSMSVAFFAPSHPFSTQRPTTLLFRATKKMRTQDGYETPSLIGFHAADGRAAMDRAVLAGLVREARNYLLRRLHECGVLDDLLEKQAMFQNPLLHSSFVPAHPAWEAAEYLNFSVHPGLAAGHVRHVRPPPPQKQEMLVAKPRHVGASRDSDENGLLREKSI